MYEITYCKVFFKKIKRLMPYDQQAIKTFHQSPSPFKIVCHNYPTPNTLIANQPSDNKKSLEFQLYLNFNYTWGFHRQNAFFQIARPVMDKKTKKNPPKMVILTNRWPKMTPNIGMLHRNPRQKGLGGQRAIAALLFRPSALPGLLPRVSVTFFTLSGLVPI